MLSEEVERGFFQGPSGNQGSHIPFPPLDHVALPYHQYPMNHYYLHHPSSPPRPMSQLHVSMSTSSAEVAQQLPPVPPSYSFTLPVSYSHDPKRPPQHHDATAALPASMDPGLDEALRRDTEYMTRVKAKSAANATGAHQYLTRQASIQHRHSSKAHPPMIASIRSAPRVSIEARSRPSSGASSRSATSLQHRPSARSYRRLTPVRPAHEENLLRRCNPSGVDRVENASVKSTRLTTASSAETKISSCLEASSTTSVSSRLNDHSSADSSCPVHDHGAMKPPCPVHDRRHRRPPCPVHNHNVMKAAYPVHQADRPPCPLHGHGTYRTGAVRAPSGSACADVIPSIAPTPSKDPEPPKKAVEHRLFAPGVPVEPVKKEQATNQLPLPRSHVVEATATKTNIPSPSESVKVKIVDLIEVEQQYARLHALHAAEMRRSYESTAYLTARNGCEAVFMPRPSLSHARHGSTGGGCMSVCCDGSAISIKAHVDEASAKELTKAQLVALPRSTFERNRRPFANPIGAGASASVPNLHCYSNHSNQASELPPPASASLLDLSKVGQHGAPDRAVTPGRKLGPLNHDKASMGIRLPRSQRSDRVAFRSRSDPDLAHFANPKSTLENGQLVMPRLSSKVSIKTTESSPDSLDGPDAVEMLRIGQELDEERARWRRDFEKSIEGRGRYRRLSLGMTGLKKRDRSQEDVFKAGPAHSCLPFDRSRRKVIQPDSLEPRHSSQLQLAGNVRLASVEQAIGNSTKEGGSIAKEPAPPQKKMSVKRKPVSHRAQKPPATSDGQVPPFPRSLEIVPLRSVSEDRPRPNGLRGDFLRKAGTERFSAGPRLSQSLRPPATFSSLPTQASVAFDRAAASQELKRVSAQFSRNAPSEELFVIRTLSVGLEGYKGDPYHPLNLATPEAADLASIARKTDDGIEVLGQKPGPGSYDSKGDSLKSHDAGDSMLALEAEGLLLEHGSGSLGIPMVEKRDMTARREASATRLDAGVMSGRQSMSSPPPHPVPNLPLPALPGVFPSSPDDSIGGSESLHLRSKTQEGHLRLSRRTSVGRPDSALEPLYDGPDGPSECSPPTSVTPIARNA